MAKRSTQASPDTPDETPKIEPHEGVDQATETVEAIETPEPVETGAETDIEAVDSADDDANSPLDGAADTAEQAPSEPEGDAAADSEADEDAASEPEAEVAPEADTAAEESPQEPVAEEISEPETEPESVSEPPQMERPAPQAPVFETVIERRGGFLPMILGGAVAAALGFGASAYLYQVGPFAAETDAAADAMRAAITRQTETSQDLAARISALETATPDLLAEIDPLAQGISATQATVETLGNDLTALGDRIANLEQRPVEGASEAAVAAFEAELARLRDDIVTQRAEVQDMAAKAVATEQAAEDVSRAALARAALTRVQSALDAGTPFAGALGDLGEFAPEGVPAALAAVADDGAPSLISLQDSFPSFARDALSASRAAGTQGADRLGSFLLNQLGARSLEPKDGAGTDAILSRAEAALRDARLTDTLAELSGLPAEAAQAVAPWVAQAQTRQDALAAAETLAQSLNSN